MSADWFCGFYTYAYRSRLAWRYLSLTQPGGRGALWGSEFGAATSLPSPPCGAPSAQAPPHPSDPGHLTSPPLLRSPLWNVDGNTSYLKSCQPCRTRSHLRSVHDVPQARGRREGKLPENRPTAWEASGLPRRGKLPCGFGVRVPKGITMSFTLWLKWPWPKEAGPAGGGRCRTEALCFPRFTSVLSFVPSVHTTARVLMSQLLVV